MPPELSESFSEAAKIALETHLRLMLGKPLVDGQPLEDPKIRETARRSATDILRIATQRSRRRADPSSALDGLADPTSDDSNADLASRRKPGTRSDPKSDPNWKPRPFTVPLPSPWPADIPAANPGYQARPG